MNTDEITNKFSRFIKDLMISGIFSLLIFPTIVSIFTQNNLVWVFMMFFFIITIPVGLIISGLILKLLKIYLKYFNFFGKKFQIFELMVVGLFIGMIIGVLFIRLSIEFYLGMIFTSGLMGIFLATFSSHIHKEKS